MGMHKKTVPPNEGEGLAERAKISTDSPDSRFFPVSRDLF